MASSRQALGTTSPRMAQRRGVSLGRQTHAHSPMLELLDKHLQDRACLKCSKC